MTQKLSGCGLADQLLLQALKVLYAKLSLTRGQIALATQLYVRESVEARGSSVRESIEHALSGLAASYDVRIAGSEVQLVVECGACSFPELCPLPYFVSAYVEKATSTRLALKDFKLEGGKCSVTYRVVPSSSRE